MNYENLKDYLSIILDMEKNAYVQEKTLRIMKSKQKALGLSTSHEKPIRNTAEPEYEIYMLKAGAVFAIIGYIIDVIANWQRFQESSGIIGVFYSLLHGLLPAIGIGIVGGLILGYILAKKNCSRIQQEYDEKYQNEMKYYNRMESSDTQRVKNELAIKSAMQSDIVLLTKKSEESQARLHNFYCYNVINQKYWHDIVAISSFYQYLLEKRTYSLEYDLKTGDRGAYNIYNEEAQRGVIISQLNVVIDKLDKIIDNQRTLQMTLLDANRKIDVLTKSVNKQTKELKSELREQTEIQAYNAERVEAELNFMNTMNVFDHILHS